MNPARAATKPERVLRKRTTRKSPRKCSPSVVKHALKGAPAPKPGEDKT